MSAADDKEYQEYQQYLEYLNHTQGASQPKPQQPESRTAAALTRGAVNGATAGYSPQIAGGVQSLTDQALQLAGKAGIGPYKGVYQMGAQGQLPSMKDTYLQARDKTNAETKALEQSNPGAMLVGNIAGSIPALAAGGALASKIPGVAGAMESLGTVGSSAASGAAQGAISNPGDEAGVIHNPLEGDIQSSDRLKNLLMGGGAGLASGIASKALNKAGDYAMQKAVGRKKYTPGVGTELADQGVIGTRNMMKNQVANKLESKGQEIGQLVDQIPGQIDNAPIASKVSEEADRFFPSSGAPAEADMPSIQKVQSMASEIAKRGEISPKEALSRRAIAGRRSFNKQNPIESLQGQASKQEQAGYSQALKDAYEEAANAGTLGPSPAPSKLDQLKALFGANSSQNPQALAEADKSFGALARANHSLNQESSIPQSLLGLGTKLGLGAGIGYAVDGGQGAALGAALGTPTGMSSTGQAANLGSKAIQALSPELIQALLESNRKK